MNYYLNALKKYAVFSGRAQRKEYWLFTLGNFIIFIVYVLVDGISVASHNPLMFLLVCLFGLYFLALIIPSIAVTVRRLHDTNHSGWWIFIDFIPLIGSIIMLVFTVTDSQPGENKYGPNPKGIAASAAATPASQ